MFLACSGLVPPSESVTKDSAVDISVPNSFYSPEADLVNMPKAESFESPEEYVRRDTFSRGKLPPTTEGTEDARNRSDHQPSDRLRNPVMED